MTSVPTAGGIISGIIAIALSMAVSISAYPQSASSTSDSIPSQILNEIVVEASKVIRKTDMDVYYPSLSAVENSKDGLQLLSNMMIPSLTVSDALETIQASGESVQIRINGREASVSQVRSLLPETIKRVEWIDNPGLRYGGASYVLNLIVTNPTLGGSFQGKARPALNQGWGGYMADVKLNSGHSQWEVFGSCKLTENLKIFRDYNEKFTYPDGSSLTRNEKPLGRSMDNTLPDYFASYSYVKPDTTVFVAQISNFQHLSNRFEYNGLLSLSDGDNDIRLTERYGDKGNYPSLSLYLQQNLPLQQIFVVDFNSQFYFGRSYSDYIEEYPEWSSVSATPITDIHTDIKDQNQVYALEADYIKSWKKSRLTAGATYTANRNRSEYENLGGEVFHQHQNRVYFFAEYFHRFGKWSATAGMGMQYTEFMFKESGQGNSSWNPRPQATLTYSPSQNHNFRLNFTSWQTAPSLSQTNVVAQQIDGFQWRVGNQDLKTANSYMLTFRYGFNLPRVNGSLGVQAFTSPNAITPFLHWEDDRLITSYENNRGNEVFKIFLSPQIDVIQDWLMISGALQWRVQRVKGTGYCLTHRGWSGDAGLRLYHWGFTLSGQYVKAQRQLDGETLSWGEDLNVIDLSYNWRHWRFGAGIIMPFGKYDQGSKSLCRWNSNEQHMRLDMRMPYVSVNYNVQWGRQKRGVSKLIEAEATTDQSRAGGR